MASELHLPENGVEGDDEREEEEEAGEEEEEEEPRLKYQRVGGSVSPILSTDAAAAIAVAERMVALGTHNGTLHILDFLGNQVKEFAAHSKTVNDICFDNDGEFVGSCSDDGSVVINSLFTEEKMKFDYQRPMKAIALDPFYSRKPSKRFVAGGLAGHLFLNTKNWFGYTKQVLHDGEGPIHAVKWRGNLVAWANNEGVKVYDMANNQRITFIEKPKGSPRPEMLLPHLVWQDDTLLMIGWGNTVKIAAIRSNISQGPNGIQKNVVFSGNKYVEIVASFQTSYHIAGIAPFGDSLVVLAYIPEEENGDKIFSTAVPSRQGTAQRPEVHIVSWKNEELTTDALPVQGYEHYKAKDYALAHAPFTGSSYAGGQWAAGDEPLYYVLSPKDIVMAKPRDAEDHIAWLLEHGWHKKALAAVEAGQGRTELLEEVGAKYLDHLIIEGKYMEAAALCPKVLQGSASAWDRWVFHFGQLRQLPHLVPHMPTENPRLSKASYKLALDALANNPSAHTLLLSTVKSWPTTLYDISAVVSSMEPQLNSSTATPSFKEALAELYVLSSQHERALGLYADLLKPETFSFIESHDLYSILHDKIVQLMILDSKRMVFLLIQHRETILPSEVVTQLLFTKKNCDKRYFLHLYLHSLFEVDMTAGKEYHDMQVELYADYEPRLLLPFLRTSQHYNLEKAYEICSRRKLIREQVYVLGRMGNAKQALAIIINDLEDIQEAVEFVTEQHDDDLWDEFIKQCIQNPEMVGMLLEHTVGNIDPLYIVSMVPNGLEIPRLRDRLVKIVTDYRTETSLRLGCNEILKWDSINLLVKYFKEARRGIYLGTDDDAVTNRQDGAGSAQILPSMHMMHVAMSRTRGRGRCCLCFDSFSIQDIPVVVFFCSHGYHIPCLTGELASMEALDAPRDSDDDDDSDHGPDAHSEEPPMRCVLCSTAAGKR